jgi:hypothetical protein
VFIVFCYYPAFAKSCAVAKTELKFRLFLLVLKNIDHSFTTAQVKRFTFYDASVSQVFHPAFERNGIHPIEICCESTTSAKMPLLQKTCPYPYLINPCFVAIPPRNGIPRLIAKVF